jgi:hypothetical protein
MWNVLGISTLRGRGINQGLKHMFGRISTFSFYSTDNTGHMFYKKYKQDHIVQGNKLYLLLK